MSTRARQAVASEGRSLLAVGVVACEGDFRPGDAVEIVAGGRAFAKGITAVPTIELDRRRRDVEAVHRDRLVLY